MRIRPIRFLFLIILMSGSGAFLCAAEHTDSLRDGARKAGVSLYLAAKGDGSGTLFYIEDAHCDYPAQKEIARVLSFLIDGGYSSTVAVEGSQGRIFTHLFSSFPVDATRNRMAENMLRTGIISGEEYLSISRGKPLTIVGVDDERAYRQNIDAFRVYYDNADNLVRALDMVDDIVDAVRASYPHRELAGLLSLRDEYSSGTVDFLTLINTALSFAGANRTFSEYPELASAYDLLSRQDQINRTVVDAEIQKLVARINTEALFDTAGKVRSLYRDYLSGAVSAAEMYAGLAACAHEAGINLSDAHPVIAELGDIVARLDTIPHEAINKQLRSFCDTVSEQLVRSDEDKCLVALSDQAQAIRQMCTLRISREEYVRYTEENTDLIESFRENLSRLSSVLPDARDEQVIRRMHENACAFYRLAAGRDQALFVNTQKLISSEPSQGVVLIAGGFHTPDIIERCSKQGITCYVIRPERVGDSSFSTYASVLLRDTAQSDMFSAGGLINTYLRASSFFADKSFDNFQDVSNFRDTFILTAIADALPDFNSKDLQAIVRQWRSAYLRVVGDSVGTDTSEYQMAQALFDAVVTDLFDSKNILIDKDNNELFVYSHARIVRISRDENGAPRIEVMPDTFESLSRAKMLDLNKNILFLLNSRVFISAWTISDSRSEHYRHGDAHYSIKYIEALNARDIAPVVILPDDENGYNETLRKYKPYLNDNVHNFSFAVYDSESGTYIETDHNITPLAQIDTVSGKKPVILQLFTSFDTESDARLRTISERLSSGTEQVASPVVIRIPAAGAVPSPIDDVPFVDLYMTPVELGSEVQNSVQSGFVADKELMDVAGMFRKHGRQKVRSEILNEIDEELAGKELKPLLGRIPGFHSDAFSNLHWSFRYLTEQTDSELASFMRAALQYPEPQVIFTFLGDSEQDTRHRRFLSGQANYIDIRYPDATVVDKQSTVLVVNLPPVDSMLFKALMAGSDAAVVSGENSLSEGLLFNKMGIGPTLLFKPAMSIHWALMESVLKSGNGLFLLDGLKAYADITDTPDSNMLDDFEPMAELSDMEWFMYSAMYDPNTSAVMRGAMSQGVYEMNGLNTLTAMIEQIDSGVPLSVVRYGADMSLRHMAENITQEFMLNDHYSLTDPTHQKLFVQSAVRRQVRTVILDFMMRDTDVHVIERLISNLQKELYSVFRGKLESAGVQGAPYRAEVFRSTLHDAVSSFEILPGGHLFSPEIVNGSLMYRHDFIDRKVFAPRGSDAEPEPQYEYVSGSAKDRLARDFRDAEIVRELLAPMYVGSPFDYFNTELMPPTFMKTKQYIGEMKRHIAFAALDYVRQIAARHAEVLRADYGVASVETLYEYLQAVVRHEKPQDSPVLSDYIALSALIGADPGTGTTNFFRDYENWQAQLENYISDIIAQKTARNDLSLSIRSVGSAIGKEAYSIAAFVEQALLKYALLNVAGDIEDLYERMKLAQQWVDKWDVNVYAFDNSFVRLATAREGMYLSDGEVARITGSRPELLKMFGKKYPGNGYFPIYSVNNRLKRWMVPVYIDLNSDLSPLERYKGEITFSMNVLRYLRDAGPVIKALKETTNPEYKGFVAYNDGFNDPPEKHGVFADQPLVLPPVIMPDAQSLATLTSALGVTTLRGLSSKLGLTDSQLGELSRGADSDRPSASKIEEYNRTRQAVDSML
ncbi:MAG: hypothetical protein AB1454_07880 [Candidatus Auribacterota bacterium]